MQRYQRFIIPLAAMVLAAASAHANWESVRDLVRQGDKLSDADKQEEIYRRAYAAAKTSAAAAPNSSNEHLWLAIAAGRLGLIAPTKERIELSKVVKDHAERAIALDASNGQAYMVLGAWHFYVSDLSWIQKNAAKIFYGGMPPASYQDAVNMLTKSLKYGVENPVEAYYLRGRANEELDNDAAAAADYKQCIQGKARSQKEIDMQNDAKDRME
jgi:tetratricopeptide (TPR) repeat protein